MTYEVSFNQLSSVLEIVYATVEANNKEDAINKINNGEYEAYQFHEVNHIPNTINNIIFHD